MATKPEKSKKTDNAEANRLARLLRTQKKQPNNTQIDSALKTTRIHRKTPTNPVWSASWRRIARLIKLFEGKFNPNIMSSNQELSKTALQNSREIVNVIKNTGDKDFFALATRVNLRAPAWVNSY